MKNFTNIFKNQYQIYIFFFTIILLSGFYIPFIYGQGVPTAIELLGQEIAKMVFDQQMEVMRRVNKATRLERSFKNFENELSKLRNKHESQRNKEKQILERMINGLRSYSRADVGRGTVNQEMDKKQQEIWRKAEEFRENDKKRASELKEFIENNYPIKSY